MSARTRSHSSVSRSHSTSTTDAAQTPIIPDAAVVPVPIKPPPPDANIPSPPKDFVQAVGGEYKGARPRKAELSALPTAVENLVAFTNYDQLLGTTAPSHAEVMQAFDVAHQWSAMRTSASSWDAYCNQQEGLAWSVLRTHMDRLQPAFMLAATGNPSLATMHAGLTALLTAKKAISHKGAATKHLNKVALAEGKEPVHGTIGKKRKRAAEKALYASAAAPAPTNGAGAAATNDAASPLVNGAHA